MKRTIWSVVSTILLWSFFHGYSQNTENALFQQGVQAYQQKNYQRAQTLFFSLLQKFPHGRLLTATKLMLGKSYYKLGDYNAVQIICQNFFRNHPQSQYMDDMHHLLGNTYFRQGKYNDALKEWLWVVENSTDSRLKAIARDYLYKTAIFYVNLPALEKLQRHQKSAVLAGLITIRKAYELQKKGNRPQAKQLLQQFLNKYPNHLFSREAKALLAEKPLVGGPVFYFLKPTIPEEAPIGTAIELGMKFALKEFRQQHPNWPLQLFSIPVGGDVLTTIQALKEQIQQQIPLAVIGPFNSDQCAAVSLYSQCLQIPYIVPTSSEVGFTEISDYAFQLNPDARLKGRFLGKYARTVLNLKRFAVLAPINNYGEAFVNSFVDAVQSQDGEVLTIQWYYEDTQDFTRQFRAIRRKGFYAAFRDSVLQKNPDLTEAELTAAFKKWYQRKFSSRQFGVKVDSTQTPSTGIDGLLIITQPESIPLIASQFAFHNIQSVLLGNEGWNDPEALEKNKAYLPDLYFISASHYNPKDWSNRDFIARFRAQMKTTPEFFHMLGYDLMKWLLTPFQPNISASQFKQKLESSRTYHGVVEDIAFGSPPRVNNKLNIMRFTMGQLVQVQ